MLGVKFGVLRDEVNKVYWKFVVLFYFDKCVVFGSEDVFKVVVNVWIVFLKNIK